MRRKPAVEDLLKRIAELEDRVKELEAQPRENHVHYHSAPVYQPPYVPPALDSLPEPIIPYRIVIGDPPGWGTFTVGGTTNFGGPVC